MARRTTRLPEDGVTAPRTFILRQLRVDTGLSQMEFAARAGLPLPVYKALENDENENWPHRTIQVLVKVADILGVAPAQLLPTLRDPK